MICPDFGSVKMRISLMLACIELQKCRNSGYLLQIVSANPFFIALSAEIVWAMGIFDSNMDLFLKSRYCRQGPDNWLLLSCVVLTTVFSMKQLSNSELSFKILVVNSSQSWIASQILYLHILEYQLLVTA